MRSARPASGFTLLELLVVIGIIGAAAFFVFSGLAGGGKTGALRTGQSLVANLVTAARAKAPATGRKVRLLVNRDPADPERYLRTILLQVGRQPGANPAEWDTFQAVSLPPGVFVVPGSLDGLVADATPWRRVSDPGEELSSDLFANQNLLYALDGESGAETWTGVAFTSYGTLAALGGGPPPKGSIVLALGQLRAPGTYPAGRPPVLLSDPASVRGLVLSAYGVPAWLNDRSAF